MTRCLSPDVISACPDLAETLGLPVLSRAPLPTAAIVVCDRPLAPAFLRLEARMRAACRPVIPLLIEAEMLRVGPVSLSGAGCAQCAEMRREARRHAPDFVALLRDHERGAAVVLPEVSPATVRVATDALHQGVNRAVFEEALMVAHRALAAGRTDHVWCRDHRLGLWHEEEVLPVWSCPHVTAETRPATLRTLSLKELDHV